MPPPAGWRRRALRIVGWNLLISIAGLAIAAGGMELYLRLVWPFTEQTRPVVFVPDVGVLLRPGAEVRRTELTDFWNATRANSLGFLDREPIDPGRAAESCHIAMIGDSFVEAREVPIANKFHVRLEEMAARTLPRLDVTTSAWGVWRTATVNQLPLYDVYARRLKPKILILVFFGNDIFGKVPLYFAYRAGWDPDRRAYFTAVQAEDGTMTLRPPSGDGTTRQRFQMERLPTPPAPWLPRTLERLRPDSHLVKYLLSRYRLPRGLPADYWIRQRELWIEILRRRPHYAWILPPRGSAEEKEWRNPARRARPPDRLPRVREYVLDFTAFALDLFKARADRDGAAFLILSVPEPKEDHPNDWADEALSAMARERGVPMIDLHEYIVRKGRDVRESHFARDPHWNATGHRWAAEALLEWIARNRHVCGAEGGPGIDEPPARG